MRLHLLISPVLASAPNILFRYYGGAPLLIGDGGPLEYFSADYPYFDENISLEFRENSLVVSKDPIAVYSSSIWDAYKFKFYSQESFDITSGKVTFQMTLSANIFGVENHPFGEQVTNAQCDPRLAMAAFTVNDPTGMAFGFIFTNGQIYAIMQPGMSPLPDDPSYPTATYHIPLAKTTPGQIRTAALIFDTAPKTISWQIDGQVLYVWKVGISIPREYCVLCWGDSMLPRFPTKAVVEWGIFTGLMYYPPVIDCNSQIHDEPKALLKLEFEKPFLNPQDGTPAKYSVDSPEQQHHVWNQGIKLTIKEIIVFNDS